MKHTGFISLLVRYTKFHVPWLRACHLGAGPHQKTGTCACASARVAAVFCRIYFTCNFIGVALQWRHHECHGLSNHPRLDYLLNRLLRRRSKKTSKLRVTGLCAGNSPAVTGEFPAQMASNAENVSIWWRPHATRKWTFTPTVSVNLWTLDNQLAQLWLQS